MGTMTAEAETESASLDWVFDEELLLSSETVGMAVGVAVEVQAERNNTVTMTSKFIFFILVLPVIFHSIGYLL